MNQRPMLVALAVLSLALLLSGCAGTPKIPADAALTISGSVGQATGWTIDELSAKDQVHAMAPCADSGRDKEFKGPSLNALLDEAKPKKRAAEVVFTGAEGYQAVVSLDAIRETTDAIVAVTPKGKCRLILPGMPEDKQVLGLTKIELR